MVILTTTGRIRDWSALRGLLHDSLAARARASGASSLQIHRDVGDASRFLIVATFADQEAACELASLVEDDIGALIEASQPICQVWETIELGE